MKWLIHPLETPRIGDVRLRESPGGSTTVARTCRVLPLGTRGSSSTGSLSELPGTTAFSATHVYLVGLPPIGLPRIFDAPHRSLPQVPPHAARGRPFSAAKNPNFCTLAESSRTAEWYRRRSRRRCRR